MCNNLECIRAEKTMWFWWHVIQRVHNVRLHVNPERIEVQKKGGSEIAKVQHWSVLK